MNKIMPQRTFSPRTFMGDRGINLDSYGRVLNETYVSLFDERVVKPKPWKVKPTNNPSFSNRQFVDENLFEEAGHEIQTIILQSFNLLDDTGVEEDQSITVHINKQQTKPTATKQDINKNYKDQINNSIETLNNNNNNNNSSRHIRNPSSTDEELITSINPLSNIIENYSQDSLTLNMKIPVFSQSPGVPEPITPPTRTHNPITLNQAFCSVDSIAQMGAEIGLLSISPPLVFKH